MRRATWAHRNSGVWIGATGGGLPRFAGLALAGMVALAGSAGAEPNFSKSGLIPAYPSAAKCPDARSLFGDRFSMLPAAGARITRKTPHKGLDIPAPVGTAVRAAASGTVESVFRTTPEGGHIVFVDMVKRNRMVYAHVEPVVRPLETVEKGQIIAFVSFYKSPVGPHLHWSTRSMRSGKFELVDSLSLFPVEGTTAKISYMDDRGRIHPPNADVIWPFRCPSSPD